MKITPVTILMDADSRVTSILVAHSKILQQPDLDEYTKEVSNDILRFCYIMVVGLFEQYLLELVSQKVTTIISQKKEKTDDLVEFINTKKLSSIINNSVLDELELYEIIKKGIKNRFSFLHFFSEKGNDISKAFKLIMNENILDKILGIKLSRSPTEEDKILFKDSFEAIIDRRHRIAHIGDYMSLAQKGEYTSIDYAEVSRMSSFLLEIAFNVYEIIEKYK